MAIRERDVKLLWSRAAGRCSFPECRRQVSTSADAVLGEMAHIVAKTPNGPRGSSDLPEDERDHYNNLILLCPNHHTQVDKEPQWNVEDLLRMKSTHEGWVRGQLEEGRITKVEIDNTSFLGNRRNEWRQNATNRLWIITSLTPLEVQEAEMIDVKRRVFQDILRETPYPRFLQNTLDVVKPNMYSIELSEHGLIHENSSQLEHGAAVRIELFRNGHAEHLICAHADAVSVTEWINNSNNWATRHPNSTGNRLRRKAASLYLDFSALADIIRYQIEMLDGIWGAGLPFEYMTLTTCILYPPAGLSLLSQGTGRAYLFGRPTENAIITYQQITNIHATADNSVLTVLQALTERLGMTLDTDAEEMTVRKLY